MKLDDDVQVFASALEDTGSGADGLSSDAVGRSWARISAHIAEEQVEKIQWYKLILAQLGAAAELTGRAWKPIGAMAVATAFLLAYISHEKPVAYLAFVANQTMVGMGSVEIVSAGILDLDLDAGSDIATRDGGAIIYYEAGAEVRVDRQTHALVAGGSSLSVDIGRVWVDVDKGRGGFDVVTPAAHVRVTGTSFGVSHDESVTRVSVAEGSVEVAALGGWGDSGVLGPGDVAVIADGAFAITRGAAPESADSWANSVRDQAAAASVSPVVPSVTVGNKQGTTP